jgi:hypothetical protein
LRDGEAERLGGFEIDDQLDLHRLLDWQIGGAGTFEDFAGVDASQARSVGKVGSVAHKAAGRGELAPCVNRRHRVTGRESYDLSATASQERIAGDDKRARSKLDKLRESSVDLAGAARRQDMQLRPERLRRIPQTRRLGLRISGVGRIDEESGDGCRR